MYQVARRRALSAEACNRLKIKDYLQARERSRRAADI